MTQTYDLTDEEIAGQEGIEQREAARSRLPQHELDRRTVYQRMVAVIDELPAIGKDSWNEQQRFHFRGHDDVMNALNPLLARHGVFIVPNVVERITDTRATSRGGTMYEVNLHVEFTFYGLLGDSFTASGWGEGTDMGDKATNKAMTAAFKYVVAQAFALATADNSDSDADATEETTRGGAREGSRGQSSQRPKREFDPAKQLMEGAIAVNSVDDANSIRLGLRDLDPAQDWPAVEEYLAHSVYGKALADLDRRETGEYWKRLANAVVKAQGESGGDFPPPTHEAIREAFAWAFNGTVLALSEPETAAEASTEAPGTPEAQEAAE